METNEVIAKAKNIIETLYKEKILENVKKDKASLDIDFSDILKLSPELADELLDNPIETIKATEVAIRQLDTLGDVSKFRARFFNLPKTEMMPISEFRSKHLGKFHIIEGLVRQKTDVRPQVATSRYECPDCGNVITLLQLSAKMKEPTRCGCGRRGKFQLLEKNLIDAQGMILEESADDLEGGEQPKRLNLLLKEDLVSPILDKSTMPGKRVRVTGILVEVPITGRDGAQLTKFDFIFEVNHIQPIEEEYTTISITEEDEKKILKLSCEHELFPKLIESVIPSIYGHDVIKEAIILQMIGGVRKKRHDGTVSRGDIHILLVGDPGAGKSQMLKRTAKLAPKGRFVSGKGVSGVGLTAAVVRDEFMNGYALEAGALVLANRGLCAVDELDKMSPDDRDALHETLEGQTVTVSKANIQATLRAETTVLCACNPKAGRFEPWSLIANQIDLPPTLLNRFDLIFSILDKPDAIKDNALVDFILNIHQDDMFHEPPLDTTFLKKYIAYARTRFNPRITEEALVTLKRYYMQMRKNSEGTDAEPKKPIAISPRQLEGLIRLSEASARVRLSNRVELADAERAIRLMQFCLEQIGYDKETGQIDIDRFSSTMTFSDKNIAELIKAWCRNNECVPPRPHKIEEIIAEITKRYERINPEAIERVMGEMSKKGECYFPRPDELLLL